MHDESLYALRALRAGAQGYVMKQEALENGVNPTREVLAGRPYLTHEMSAKLITNFASGSSQVNPRDKLTARERAVRALMAKGRDMRQMAHARHSGATRVQT